MDNNDNDSNKTTIRVKLSDDDYTDIIFDWTKKGFDFNRSIFLQLSSFTGINIKHVGGLWVIWPQDRTISYTNNSLNNPDFKRPFRRRLFTIKNDGFLRDGDCFWLEAFAFVNERLDYIDVDYRLSHQDYINETGCNRFFCHVRGTRLFTDRLAKAVNSDIDSYIRAIPNRPRVNLDPNGETFSEEYYAAFDRVVIKMYKDLDIGLVFQKFCAANFHPGLSLFTRDKPRLYSPDRG